MSCIDFEANTLVNVALHMSKVRRVAIQLGLDWPYKRHSAIFAGTQRYAQEQNWQSTVDEYVEDTLQRHQDDMPYDGVIARATSKLATRAARMKVPVVNVWTSSPAWKRLPSVFADYRAIGRMRAEHLLSRGLRRFAALIAHDNRAEELELETFCETITKAGFECLTERVALNPYASAQEWRQMERIVAAWMKKWELPIGVYIGSETEGRIVAQACRNLGWRVPEDVAIIAGRNEETLCEGLRPTLSSVELGYERIGYEAASLLDKLMDGAKPPAEPILIAPRGLVVRESTDFYAVDDSLITAALKFIATNCHRDIGQDDVARAVASETSTLQRRFRKYLDRPIATEIRRVRLERAKRELAQGTRSMAQIARDVGFGEPMRMYEVFRRELGVTPSQYRRERQNPNH
jgi:LacI family transcriptional regulator